tara:strand:+ start:1401 stop:2543 length:1143 start_codon:yes stop_codon:yes gene_type:complete
MQLIYSKIAVFFLLIILGISLKNKFGDKPEKLGIKKFILNISLPATILISFISFKIELDFLYLPLAGIALNLFIFLLSPSILKITKINKLSRKGKTLTMLLSSFAPGISCFPIIEEFLGSEYLVRASLIDFGNKLFVLVFLLILSYRLHYLTQGIKYKKNNILPKNIIKSIFTEPINLVLIFSTIILSLGFTIDEIPKIFVDLLNRMKDTLTPLVLIFIGLSIIFSKEALKDIIPVLFIRAGVCLFFTICAVNTFGLNGDHTIFYLALSLSSVSFWPFAHMTLINEVEKKAKIKNRTFDLGYGLNFLAYSLPFSTILILLLVSQKSTVLDLSFILFLSIIMILIGFVIVLINSRIEFFKKPRSGNAPKKWSLNYFFQSLL